MHTSDQHQDLEIAVMRERLAWDNIVGALPGMQHADQSAWMKWRVATEVVAFEAQKLNMKIFHSLGKKPAR